ncbi:MAG: 3-keto-5-aminohexanoate cleavage protein, partial [Gammaproteobacteria bacterium]|nr:3-keto-5-aminohexanoate cleavage protein [Gammaproteobacteria bacterium]
LEVFEPGHIMFAHKLIEEGLIEGKPMFQLCLGIPHASPATAEILTVMKNLLPDNANWSAFGISRFEFAIVAQAASQGGNCRVGLEDNLYLNKDEFASNLQLVERAVRIIRELGREPATATQAAERLGIKRS